MVNYYNDSREDAKSCYCIGNLFIHVFLYSDYLRIAECYVKKLYFKAPIKKGIFIINQLNKSVTINSKTNCPKGEYAPRKLVSIGRNIIFTSQCKA